MKNNHFESLEFSLLRLKQPRFENWRISAKNRVLILARISLYSIVKYVSIEFVLFFCLAILLLKFDRQSLSSRMIAILEPASGSLALRYLPRNV